MRDYETFQLLPNRPNSDETLKHANQKSTGSRFNNKTPEINVPAPGNYSSFFTFKTFTFALIVLLLLLLGYYFLHDFVSKYLSQTVVPETSTLYLNSAILFSSNRRLETELNIVVGVASYTINDVIYTYRTRTINYKNVGPELRVRRGDTVVIHLNNKLEDDGSRSVNNRQPENAFRYPNTTALHLHGIHASPVFEDNVFRVCHPGESLVFEYYIREDHPTGTYFFHPHFLGSSSLQTASKMVAGVVIEDDAESIRGTVLENVEQDIMMIIGLVEFGGGSGNDIIHESLVSGSQLKPEISKHIIGKKGTHPIISSLSNEEKVSFLTVNGIRSPTVKIKEKTWNRLRILNSVVDGNLAVTLEHDAKKKDDFPCVFQIVAADGVYFQNRKSRPAFNTVNDSTILPPGSRKDIVLFCTSTVDGFYLSSRQGSSTEFLGSKSKILTGTIIRVVVESALLDDGQLRSTNGSASLQAIRYSKQNVLELPQVDFRDLINLPKSTEQSVDRFLFRNNFGGPESEKRSVNGYNYTYYGINDKQYSGEAQIAVKLNKIHEWVITNDFATDGSVAKESHPFHLHTNHFQIIRTEPSIVNSDFETGDYRDTISIPPRVNVTIRFMPLDYTGKSLAHCHTLTHEDTGMMMAYEITE